MRNQSKKRKTFGLKKAKSAPVTKKFIIPKKIVALIVGLITVTYGGVVVAKYFELNLRGTFSGIYNIEFAFSGQK